MREGNVLAAHTPTSFTALLFRRNKMGTIAKATVLGFSRLPTAYGPPWSPAFRRTQTKNPSLALFGYGQGEAPGYAGPHSTSQAASRLPGAWCIPRACVRESSFKFDTWRNVGIHITDMTGNMRICAPPLITKHYYVRFLLKYHLFHNLPPSGNHSAGVCAGRRHSKYQSNLC